MHIRYHIGCIYSLMRIYGLTCIRYHIFHIYMIPHILTISHVLTIFLSSYLPYDMAPCRYNDVYISLYGLLWPCTNYPAFRHWNLCTIPGVTPTVSNYHNNCWKTKLIYISNWKMKTDTRIGWIQVPQGVTQHYIKNFH